MKKLLCVLTFCFVLLGTVSSALAFHERWTIEPDPFGYGWEMRRNYPYPHERWEIRPDLLGRGWEMRRRYPFPSERWRIEPDPLGDGWEMRRLW